MDEMFASRKTNLICVLIVVLLLFTACAQAEPTPTESAVAALQPGEPTAVVVRILNLDLVAVATSPTPVPPTPTPLPTLAPLPTPAALAPTMASTNTIPVCTNIAEFVKNLSIADNTAFKPGQSFAKIWQIRNAGTCTWTTAYSLVYASGESMGSLASILLPREVKPGETIDLRLSLIAPQDPATYTGNWYLQDASGAIFGLGADGVQPLGVTILVRPVPRPPI